MVQLVRVVIECRDPEGPARFFEAIVGAPPIFAGGREHSPPTATFAIGSATLVLRGRTDGQAPSRDANASIGVAASDVITRSEGLSRAKGGAVDSVGRLAVRTVRANGLLVELEPLSEFAAIDQPSAIQLDHVALVVADLQAAANRWEDILGVVPEMVIPHPLGGSDAARFLLGERMIELVSPWPGVTTAMRKRLDSVGEGPITLALVAKDLDATMRAAQDAGATLIAQPPHVFVHPRDTGGVLLQLTPRLEH